MEIRIVNVGVVPIERARGIRRRVRIVLRRIRVGIILRGVRVGVAVAVWGERGNKSGGVCGCGYWDDGGG